MCLRVFLNGPYFFLQVSRRARLTSPLWHKQPNCLNLPQSFSFTFSPIHRSVTKPSVGKLSTRGYCSRGNYTCPILYPHHGMVSKKHPLFCILSSVLRRSAGIKAAPRIRSTQKFFFISFDRAKPLSVDYLIVLLGLGNIF